MPRPRTDRTARRAELVSVATRVFAERGVANTAVSDIVKAAGIAQGTFYLYFESRDDLILAVVERIAEQLLSTIAEAAALPGSSAVEKFRALGDAFTSFDADPGIIELAEFIHRPENGALHDRLSEHLLPGLLPLVESIVEQGVTEGDFAVADVRAATWFVIGGLQSVELSGTPVERMSSAVGTASELALRALGYRNARV